MKRFLVFGGRDSTRPVAPALDKLAAKHPGLVVVHTGALPAVQRWAVARGVTSERRPPLDSRYGLHCAALARGVEGAVGFPTLGDVDAEIMAEAAARAGVPIWWPPC